MTPFEIIDHPYPIYTTYEKVPEGVFMDDEGNLVLSTGNEALVAYTGAQKVRFQKDHNIPIRRVRKVHVR